jgi:DNA repair photolyase
MTGPIYAPKGHAEPYAKLALNPYLTCPTRCPYCYNAVRNPAFFSDVPRIRGGSAEKLLAALDKQCAAWTGEKPPVHLTFLGDSYQPAEAELMLTRRCIEKLHYFGFPVQILTKAGELPARDFDLLGLRDKFGITLTTLNYKRMALLEKAQELHIPTWLSLEPVMDLNGALMVLSATAAYLQAPDPLWIGPLNHKARAYDWPEVKTRLKAEAERLRLTVQFKDDVASRKTRAQKELDVLRKRSAAKKAARK